MSSLLRDRLRTEGVVPADAIEPELRRVFPSPSARVQGAWSWTIHWQTRGTHGAISSHSAGSQFPMSVCVRADRWLVTEVTGGDLCIDPVGPGGLTERD
jgi:hypothetical protein